METPEVDDLQAADAALAKLRLYIRLAEKWRWPTPGQYRHVAKMTTAVGKLLGGWLKTVSGYR